MWRPSFAVLGRIIRPSLKERTSPHVFYSTKSRLPKSTAKLTLVSASVGVLIGAGYGGYTHYKINMKKTPQPGETEEYAFLKELPAYKPQYRVINEADTSKLQLVLFQYRTCPFCCKVRAYLDSRGISYEVVEVDAVLRQAIKWSGYKKVPILLAKVDDGYQQLMDSSAIMSVLETYLQDTSTKLPQILNYYPAMKFKDDSGKDTTEIANRYFVMQGEVPSPEIKQQQIEERKWRQWADSVLVHTLSPNVYRNLKEALETFRWFEEAGGWKETFPAWECALMVYVGAVAMYLISKRLKKRHQIKEDERQSLYDAANHITRTLKKKGTRFLGGDQPNLGDVAVYGVLSSIEGCQAFQDLRSNTSVGRWYDDIKEVIERRKGRVEVVKV